jgi:hypothetical protein
MEKSPHFVRLPLRAMQDGFSQWQIERMIRLAQQLPAEPTGMSKVQLQAWRCSPEGKPWLQVGRKMIEADKIGALYAAFGEAPEDKLPDHVTPPDELTLAEWELWFDDQGRGWPNGWRDIRTILALPSNATSRWWMRSPRSCSTASPRKRRKTTTSSRPSKPPCSTARPPGFVPDAPHPTPTQPRPLPGAHQPLRREP